ncbi:hypothetical protein JOM56_002182 [Amanita muscaria]
MFARWARPTLRRCLHTRVSPSTSSTRLSLGLGVSAAAAATYLTWRLTSDNYRIALDGPQAGQLPGSKKTPLASASNTGVSPSTETPEDPHKNAIPASDEPKNETNTESSAAGQEQGQEDASESNGSNGGAFNPETGEINWDCPCLGGMAHGPCGLQFREAFSCFVFSEAEPKGMDCVEKFQAMQDCFRAHPEVYADEIADDEEENTPASSEEASSSPEAGKDEALPIQTSTDISLDDTPGSSTSSASS